MNDEAVYRTAPATPGLLIRQSVGASRWRVCYQRGLPRLVYSATEPPDLMERLIPSMALPENSLQCRLSLFVSSPPTKENPTMQIPDNKRSHHKKKIAKKDERHFFKALNCHISKTVRAIPSN